MLWTCSFYFYFFITIRVTLSGGASDRVNALVNLIIYREGMCAIGAPNASHGERSSGLFLSYKIFGREAQRFRDRKYAKDRRAASLSLVIAGGKNFWAVNRQILACLAVQILEKKLFLNRTSEKNHKRTISAILYFFYAERLKGPSRLVLQLNRAASSR